MTTNQKPDLTYFAIMCGGVPMTAQGAKRYAQSAMMAGYSWEEVKTLIPQDFLRKEVSQ